MLWLFAGASFKLASVVLVAALLQGDENPLRLVPPVFQGGAAVPLSSQKLLEVCLGGSRQGAPGELCRHLPVLTYMEGWEFTALVHWIRVMHVHCFQELRAQSVLPVPALCHMDALRELPTAVAHCGCVRKGTSL